MFVRACVCGRPRAGMLRLVSPVGRALAAGATFTNTTTNALWAARSRHSSVIDAAGAIYVIGGWNYVGGIQSSATIYQDVWVSTDGGADRTRAGCSGWLLGGDLRGFFRGAEGYYRGTRRSKMYSRGY
jgi:hypothetical protein